MHAALSIIRASPGRSKPPKYGRDIEDAVSTVAAAMSVKLGDNPLGLTPRGLAILLLEADAEFRTQVGELERGRGGEIISLVDLVAADISVRHDEEAPIRIARKGMGSPALSLSKLRY